MKQKQIKQAVYYNRNARDLQPLEEGDVVRMKPFVLGRKEWKKAVVTRRLDERSYEVQTPDSMYRRNRVHLKKTNETPVDLQTSAEPSITAHYSSSVENKISRQTQLMSPPVSKPVQTPLCEIPQESHPVQSPVAVKSPVPGTSPVRSRSGRVIREPSYLRDYAK